MSVALTGRKRGREDGSQFNALPTGEVAEAFAWAKKLPNSPCFQLFKSASGSSPSSFLARKLDGRVSVFMLDEAIGLDEAGRQKGTIASIFKVRVLGIDPNTRVPIVRSHLALKMATPFEDHESLLQVKNEWNALQKMPPQTRGLPRFLNMPLVHTGQLKGFLMDLYECDYEKRLARGWDGDRAFSSRGREFKDMAHGLAYVHLKGYMHRDVKAANFLFRKNEVVLSDFGRTRSILELRDGVEEVDTDLRYPYISPEDEERFTNLPADLEAKKEELQELLLEIFDLLGEDYNSGEGLPDAMKFEELIREAEELFRRKEISQKKAMELETQMEGARQTLKEIQNMEKEFEMLAQAIDVFNLGLIFYQACYGGRPYELDPDSSQSVVFEKSATGEKIPLPAKEHPMQALPQGLKELIFEMVRPRPEDRPSMQNVLLRLEEIFPSQGCIST